MNYDLNAFHFILDMYYNELNYYKKCLKMHDKKKYLFISKKSRKKYLEEREKLVNKIKDCYKKINKETKYMIN